MKKDKKPKLTVAELITKTMDKEIDDENMLGHNVNTGEFNETLLNMFLEYEALEENKKQISKAQADIKAKAKEQFSIQKKVFGAEIADRKLDKAVRSQFEQQRQDLKVMLGYQMSLALDDEDHGDNPEEAAERLAK